MPRPEVATAWVIGAALPLLETLRRRTNFDDLPAYADDFLAGGLLLWAAWAVTRGRWFGRGLLIAAWGILCGGMYYSFFGQLAAIGRPDISGLPGAWVVAAKGALFAIAIAGLVLSVRSLQNGDRPADLQTRSDSRHAGS